jgi:NCAIR mutase (PurE)-related protein
MQRNSKSAMDVKLLEKLLEEVKEGRLGVTEALERLRHLPFEDLGFARVDHHWALRQGFPEVVFAEGKATDQLQAILAFLKACAEHTLMTRLSPDKAEVLLADFPEAQYHPISRVLTLSRGEVPERGRGIIVVISAGTSDIPVAEEAALTARIMGHQVDSLYDCGVAGLHRLLAHSIFSARPPCSWW